MASSTRPRSAHRNAQARRVRRTAARLVFAAACTLLAACGASDPGAPQAPPGAAPPSVPTGTGAINGRADVWVMVLAAEGACIDWATVRVVGGQAIGESRTQDDFGCNAWSYNGGVWFRGLTQGAPMTLRASAAGYADREVTVTPHLGGQVATLITLSVP